MKKKFVDYYMKLAELTASLSYARRLKVGAVLVKGNQILATGYNGMPAGWDNNCEDEVSGSSGGLPMRGLVTKPEVLHAEMNALMKVARSTESSEGAVMFCTHAPCIECAKAIYQAGISKVYFKEEYRSSQGINFLKLGEVDVSHYE